MKEISRVYIRQVKGIKKPSTTTAKLTLAADIKPATTAPAKSNKGRVATQGKNKRLFHIQDAAEIDD